MDLALDSFDSVFPNASQFRETCRSQEFPFPMPLMKYLWSNPSSPEIYQKLIQSCKLFFIKNQILIAENMEWRYWNGWKCCCGYSCNQHRIKINMYTLKAKIWISKQFSVLTSFKWNFFSCFFPKVYRYNVKILKLYEQKLSYDELKFFAAGGIKEYILKNSIIKYDNGEKVPLENVVKLFAGAEKVSIGFNETVCNSYDELIDACSIIKKIKLMRLSPNFNVSEFYQRLKCTKNRCIIFMESWFDRNRLDEIADEILETEIFGFVPPVITYFLHDKTKLENMKEIQANEVAKYC